MIDGNARLPDDPRHLQCRRVMDRSGTIWHRARCYSLAENERYARSIGGGAYAAAIVALLAD